MTTEPRLQDSRLLAAYHGLMLHHEAAREAIEGIDQALKVRVPIAMVEHVAAATEQIRAVRELLDAAVSLAEPAVEIAGTR